MGSRITIVRARAVLLVGASALLVAACGGSGSDGGQAEPMASRGQVAATPAYKVSHYAASRFAEQASFGPTPVLVAEIRIKGFEPWIDEQLALPVSRIDVTPFQAFVDPVPNGDWQRYRRSFPDLAIAAADQLRLRVTWALSQFIVTSDRKGDIVGVMYWNNMLQQYGMGRYDELLYQISVHPMMGQYLDNNQNRPKSDECTFCAPNENYARELMQLFSLGVFKLNPDGTPIKDERGKLQETYTQRDVEELARVLTGWRHDPEPPNRPNRNWANWAKPMVPTTWPPERDSGAKSVLGKSFPAGQTQEKDLRDAIAMLMAHPNIAPFVATRMIQHLVKSDPSPAFVRRVAEVFRNNGRSVAGDMTAVVKAVLLDDEARAADTLGAQATGSGKVREPFLHQMALWRALGCTRLPTNQWGPVLSGSQQPFNAESVFSFYSPMDRAPGSNLLAPEQKLLTPVDIRNRLSLPEWPSDWNSVTNTRGYQNYAAAGCKLDEWRAAFARSPLAFNDLLASRYFRGAMPPTLRSNIEQMMQERYPPWNRDDPTEGALRVTGFALATPYYGVSK